MHRIFEKVSCRSLSNSSNVIYARIHIFTRTGKIYFRLNVLIFQRRPSLENVLILFLFEICISALLAVYPYLKWFLCKIFSFLLPLVICATCKQIFKSLCNYCVVIKEKRFIYFSLKIIDCFMNSYRTAVKRNWPAGNYMFKVNKRNTRTRCEICSKLTIKTLERCQWHVKINRMGSTK